MCGHSIYLHSLKKTLENRKKNIAILGSTGSIGKQAIDVISANPEKFQVEVLTANNNAELLIEQALAAKPNAVVIRNEALYDLVQGALDREDIKVYAGENAICAVVEMESVDLVLSALVGYSGLRPTLKAIDAGKNIALANKETLVVAGDLITRRALEKNVQIFPVDSEHSAIFQCIVGEYQNNIEKIILTASGGPFRGKTSEALQNVTSAQALKHPNWNMGAKITIDSATLMNKGLEVIEAKWLFDVEPHQIEVIVHPQSIIHSMVQFEDGSIKAQMGLPDMRLPIQFALSYPDRLKNKLPRFDFTNHTTLTFEQPDLKTFRNLALAYDALHKGGNMPCILNAANEIAVHEFLKGNIGFLEISEIIEYCMKEVPFIKSPEYEDYVNTDKETRIKALEKVS